MAAYKDEKMNTWYCQFYYNTWTGERKKKFKRGFSTKKEAQEWEREFLSKQQANPDMLFKSLVELYFEDMGSRLRKSTLSSKRYMVDTKILSYFKDLPINQIKATHVRKWQNELLNQKYAGTYLKTINNQLVAILNYAVKYYDLKENPCHKAGSMGKKNAEEMQIWTKDEFSTFLPFTAAKPHSKTAFEVLYWTGIRIGELMALTPRDINFDTKTLTINKSYQRLDKEDIISEPKTPKSNRIITLPDFLCTDLHEYMGTIYDLQPGNRLFNFTKHFLHHEMEKCCKKSGTKKIRLHDLRHSHASLLIELGFSPLLISERLGHENIETTLNTYSHLYPNKHSQVSAKLQEIHQNSEIESK